jgi:hypothetical protein
MVLSHGDDEDRATCTRCDVGWRLWTVDGRPMVTTTRKLSSSEVRFLYARM